MSTAKRECKKCRASVEDFFQKTTKFGVLQSGKKRRLEKLMKKGGPRMGKQTLKKKDFPSTMKIQQWGGLPSTLEKKAPPRKINGANFC